MAHQGWFGLCDSPSGRSSFVALLPWLCLEAGAWQCPPEARIEADALASGVQQLRTEASQFSRPLLERRGWCVEAPETILIGGVPFERYRMVKLLRQAQS